MYLYKVIEIVNKEPLKIGTRGSSINQTDPSKDYIPGSTLRGALIAQMIKANIFNEATKYSILSQIEFYNAYLYRNKRLYLPTPNHLRVDKHSWRKEKAKIRYGNNAEQSTIPLINLVDPNESQAKNMLEYRFSAVKEMNSGTEQDVALLGAKIKKEYTLHHSTIRRPGEKERENLFRYQAISPGQTFRAIIKFNQALNKLIQPLFQGTSTIYLGGSRGSGYGQCQIQCIGETTSDYEKVKHQLDFSIASSVAPSNKLVITCLSDCLLRDAYGQPIHTLPREYLEEIWGQPVQKVKQFIQTGITEGYNTTWKARYPKETTLKAGSVLVYEFATEKSEHELREIISALESKLIGHRTQDGFGWIGVNMLYPKRVFVQEEQQFVHLRTTHDEGLLQRILAHQEHEKTITTIFSGLGPLKERWLDMICSKELKNKRGKASLIISDELKKNHLQKMIKVISEMLGDLQEKKMPDFKKKTSERDYERDNRLCSIAGVTFTGMREFLSSPETTDKFSVLEKYAQNKLSTQRGTFFYWEVKYPEKQFIAELLLAGLYIQQRRKDNGESN